MNKLNKQDILKQTIAITNKLRVVQYILQHALAIAKYAQFAQ